VTKSMFGMAIAIVLLSLVILLLPFFFANAAEPRSLYSGEKCGTAVPGLWWGTPVNKVPWITFKEKDLKNGVEIYVWESNHSPLFHDYAQPPTQARAKSFEFWFRNDKLIAVRAEFTGGQFDKMLTILAGIYQWHHTRFHQDTEERFAEFVYISCDTEIVALKYKMGNKGRNLVTWYYKPFCKGLLREEQPWITPK
jgi:hypothetical protein